MSFFETVFCCAEEMEYDSVDDIYICKVCKNEISTEELINKILRKLNADFDENGKLQAQKVLDEELDTYSETAMIDIANDIKSETDKNCDISNDELFEMIFDLFNEQKNNSLKAKKFLSSFPVNIKSLTTEEKHEIINCMVGKIVFLNDWLK